MFCSKLDRLVSYGQLSLLSSRLFTPEHGRGSSRSRRSVAAASPRYPCDGVSISISTIICTFFGFDSCGSCEAW